MSAIILLILRILLAVLLYAFLGWVVFTLWRDLKRQGELIAARQPPPLTLTTDVHGPLLIRHFSTPEVILGRDAGCDFSVNDQTVSSRHARLSYHQSQWWLEDMASTNGTYLNGMEVTAPVVITQGDGLRLGQVSISIAIGKTEN